MSARTHRGDQRGFSIIEAMIASIVMLVGLLGLAALQVVGVRSNHFGKHMTQASQLAQDFVENIQRWDYNDVRLTPAVARSWNVQNSASTAAVDNEWETGRGVAATHTDGSAYTADFTDGTTNASKTAALAAAFCTPNPPGCPYTGLSGDVDGDGVLDYQRYWNVWTTSFDGSTTTGKFIQVIVRWKEPVLGYRQISASTFKEIPNQLDTGL
ncbi:MAG: prepilin-type N-terminal cleavage/methylation domain-containing protein [Myxococcales bacterium]